MALNKPHLIFAFFSLLLGLLLVFLIPPIGGIDENHHIRRASEISEFVLLNPLTHTEDKLSLWSDNGWVLRKNYYEEKKPWHFNDIKTIQTGQPQEKEIEIEKNILAVHNPIIYAPSSLVLKFANMVFHPDYWMQFYILRLTALFCSVALLTVAIARTKEHKVLFAALCLLPVMLYNRSTFNVDGILIGCTFLFLIQFHNLCRKNNAITVSEKISLIMWGFLMAQCKGAYAPLLFIILLLPKTIFTSKRDRAITILLVIIPALVCGLGWSNFAKNTVLSGVQYFTEGTVAAWPDGQFIWITQHPFLFAQVLFKTIFMSPFLAHSLLGMVGYVRWNGGFTLPILPILLLIMVLMMIAAYEPAGDGLYKSIIEKIALAIIASATFVLMLTMLYVQWNSYQSPIVIGFQGRYFYPILPILVVFVKPIKELENKKRATLLLWVFGLISSVSTLVAVFNVFYS